MPPEALLVRPRYGKPVDVFSLACITLHVMSHQWPEPKDRVQEDPVTYEMRALKEVERREQYLHGCTFPTGLKPLVESCLHNQPDFRLPVSRVCVELKKLRDSVSKQVPFAMASTIELFDTVQQQKLQIIDLQTEIKSSKTDISNAEQRVRNAEQQLSKLENELEQEHQQTSQLLQLKNELQQQNSVLQQQINEKEQQIEMFASMAAKCNEAAVNQFRQGREQYQFYIQKVLSAQDQMSQAMDQVGWIIYLIIKQLCLCFSC